MAAAEPMALVAVAAGHYVENVVIMDKAVRLWGVCPDLVTIEDTGVKETECPVASICVAWGAGGTEIGGVTITGAGGTGLAVFQADAVRLERSWVRDNRFGIEVVRAFDDSAELVVQGSRLSSNTLLGAHVAGSSLELHESVIETTQPLSNGTYGRGVNVDLSCSETSEGITCDTGMTPSLLMRRSVVSDNHELGVNVNSANVIMEGSVVRRTWPEPFASAFGRGFQSSSS